MKMIAKQLCSVSLLTFVLTACGASDGVREDSETAGVDNKGGWVMNNGDAAGSQGFNFAKFSKENKSLKGSLGKYSESGNTYLGFGDKKKFRAEMNMTVQTFGEKSDSAAERQIAAGYWLDTFVFDQKIGGTNNRGMTLDLGAVAHMDTLKADVVVRFVGQDLYKGETKEAAYENSFMRDFNYEAVVYPVPMIGLKIGGTVGGELGMRVAAGVRRDNAIGLNFVPRTAISGGITGGVVLLSFASAEAQGTAQLADLKVGSSANLGMIPSGHLAYGNIGIDGGDFKALDGKVDLLAKAGLGNVLPAGVAKNAWKWISDKIGVKTDYEWRHTIWDPKPLYVAKIPRLGSQFASFYAKPKNNDECRQAQASGKSKVNEHVDTLSKYRDSSEGMTRISAEAALESFNGISATIGKLCK